MGIIIIGGDTIRGFTTSDQVIYPVDFLKMGKSSILWLPFHNGLPITGLVFHDGVVAISNFIYQTYIYKPMDFTQHNWHNGSISSENK